MPRNHACAANVATLAAVGPIAAIPAQVNRGLPYEFDRHLCAATHLIQNLFAKLNHFRAIAPRHDKAARNFPVAATSRPAQSGSIDDTP